MPEQSCYHCGLPVPDNAHFPVTIAGVAQPMCCPGCQAVASTIVDGGLEKFYQYRSANAVTPEGERADHLSHYDLPEIQRDFVTFKEDGSAVVELAISGITCSACAWLIEHHTVRVDGVVAANVNVSSHRCRLVWRPGQVLLSQLLAEFEAIGYEARPAGDVAAAQQRTRENRTFLLRLGIAGLGMMQAGMVAITLYAGEFYGIEPEWQQLLRWLSLLLATPVVLFSARPFYHAAWRSLKSRHLVMDVPVAIAITLAYSASIWATVTNTGEVYFDSVSMFTFFLLLGRYLEMRVRHRNDSYAGSLAQLVPQVAVRLGAKGEQEAVPVKSLAVGDIILVRNGETLPIDGEVHQGASEVVEAILTGEQRPVAKFVGDTVSAGTVNRENPLHIRVSAIGSNTRLAAILDLVSEAQAVKPRFAAMADRMSGWFVARLLVISVVVTGVWLYIDPSRALWVTLSVLVVTCPCALSLATPAALTVATAELRRRGFLIRKAHVLETLAAIDHCIFDKTGTLTQGRMRIEQVVPQPGVVMQVDGESAARSQAPAWERPISPGSSRPDSCVESLRSHAGAWEREVERVVPQPDSSADALLRIAAALESGATHPIAKAFRQVVGSWPNVQDSRVVVGQGVLGVIGGERHALGKKEFCVSELGLVNSDTPVETGESEAGLWLFLASESGFLGAIRLEDELRPGAAQVIADLHALNLDVSLLSGDRPPVVAEVARTLGIEHWQGAALPEDKLERVRNLQRAGGKVMMVGDGINDVPVLSGADISVAMGDAVDLTRLHADALLVSGNLDVLADAVRIARKTTTIIRQNLAWALGYNLLALPLAAMGQIPPWAAAIGMSASSLIVVVNGLRLGRGNLNRA